jgi:hypothetical protein
MLESDDNKATVNNAGTNAPRMGVLAGHLDARRVHKAPYSKTRAEMANGLLRLA